MMTEFTIWVNNAFAHPYLIVIIKLLKVSILVIKHFHMKIICIIIGYKNKKQQHLNQPLLSKPYYLDNFSSRIHQSQVTKTPAGTSI